MRARFVKEYANFAKKTIQTDCMIQPDSKARRIKEIDKAVCHYNNYCTSEVEAVSIITYYVKSYNEV